MTAMLPTIRAIRPMTQEELDAEGWSDTKAIPLLIETTDGSIYYPASDIDNTEPGEWVVLNREGEILSLDDVVDELIGQEFPMINHGRRDTELFRQWHSEDPFAWTTLRFNCGLTLEPNLIFGRLSNNTPFVLY